MTRQPIETTRVRGSLFANGPCDWPDDARFENGNYSCVCCMCGIQFVGLNRRVVCRECAK